MATQYTVHPIDETTYAIEEKTRVAQGLCYLLCGEERALLIDTCYGHEGFLQTVRRLTALPVVVANTHAHLDHIGGNHYFEELWFHEADKEIFTLHTNPRYTRTLLVEGLPKPVQALVGLVGKSMLEVSGEGSYQYFGDSQVFHLGGRDVRVVPTPGHTPGSVCFLDAGRRMLFSGDTVCEWGILLHFKGEGCPPEVFRDSMLRLKGHWDEFDTIWPGHHGFPVDKSYVDDYLACATKVVEGTAEIATEKGRLCAKHARVLISLQPSMVKKGEA